MEKGEDEAGPVMLEGKRGRGFRDRQMGSLGRERRGSHHRRPLHHCRCAGQRWIETASWLLPSLTIVTNPPSTKFLRHKRKRARSMAVSIDAYAAKKLTRRQGRRKWNPRGTRARRGIRPSQRARHRGAQATGANLRARGGAGDVLRHSRHCWWDGTGLEVALAGGDYARAYSFGGGRQHAGYLVEDPTRMANGCMLLSRGVRSDTAGRAADSNERGGAIIGCLVHQWARRVQQERWWLGA
ncbi:hypothetical protein FB45DRAFT_901067 [Roridomyces roridus]|uniref:Uncharacterized protein n=1 Tax=Roridomyces roridus TaxID=1738132 RepID=A0AAD7FVT9_9AGAR|nr:hypothetical protein FB45DRAFT_901067 [Roridomyces roridus]